MKTWSSARTVRLPSRVSRKALRARVADAYEALGLPVPDPSALCSRLPPADRKILEIVRAFSSGARFVLLDEPSASLDPRMTDWLIGAMHEAARGRSLGIIFVSHRLREVQRGTDRVTILRDGTVVWDGPATGSLRRTWWGTLRERKLRPELTRPRNNKSSAVA